MKQEETSCPKMLKVLYFPLILCYIRALFLFLPYRTQLKIGISNAKATQHIFSLLLKICFYTRVVQLVKTQGKTIYLIVLKKHFYWTHHNRHLFYRDKGTQDVAYQDKGAQFFCRHPTVKEGKKKGQMDTSMWVKLVDYSFDILRNKELQTYQACM